MTDELDDELGLDDERGPRGLLNRSTSTLDAGIRPPAAAPATASRIPPPSAGESKTIPPLTLRGISPPKQPTQLDERQQRDEAEAQRLERTGSGISQIQHGSPEGGIGIAKPHRVWGGILRGLDVAGSVIAPGVMENIPGTQLHHAVALNRSRRELGQDVVEQEKQATATKDVAQANAANRNDALTRALLAKGYTLGDDPTTGEPTLTDVPGFQREKPEPLFDKSGAIIGFQTGEGLVDLNSSKITPEMKAIAQASKPKPTAPNQEQNKLAFQSIIGKVDAAGLPTGVKNLDKSLDAAKQKGVISPEEHATARAYLAANPTPATSVDVHVAGQEEGQGLKDRNMHALVDDGNGHTRMGTVAEAKAAGVDYTPIKDPEVVTQTGRMANTIQIAMNRLADPQLLKLFDNPGARAIISTATDDTAARQFGAVIPGIGGIMIPVPGGVSKFIDSALQNSHLAGNDAAAVREYLAAYWSAREAMMNLMRLQSGGKQGARGQFQADAAIQQLPGGKTPDSHIASLQMQYAQEGLDQYRSGIPDTLPGFKKEKSFLETGQTKGAGGGAPQDFGPASDGKPEGATGKLPDGTKVVVKGGRLVGQ